MRWLGAVTWLAACAAVIVGAVAAQDTRPGVVGPASRPGATRPVPGAASGPASSDAIAADGPNATPSGPATQPGAALPDFDEIVRKLSSPNWRERREAKE